MTSGLASVAVSCSVSLSPDRVAFTPAHLAMVSPLYLGPTIVTRYLGPTNVKPSRIVATLKRDSDTIYRATVPYQTGYEEIADSQSLPIVGDVERSRHWRAVSALLAKRPFAEHPFIPVACGHDRDAYFWVCVSPYQLESGAAAALNVGGA